MHLKVLFIFLFVFSLKANSQNLDSIFNSKKRIGSSIKNDTKRFNSLYKSGLYFYSKKITYSEYFFQQALLNLKDKENTKKANTLWKLGLIEKRKGELGPSLRYLNKAKEIFKKNNDNSNYASIHFDIGVLYRHKNQKDLELLFYKKGLKLSKDLKGKVIAKSYLSYGNYYAKTNQLDSSIYYYHKALNIYKRLKNENKIHSVYNNIANTYFKQKKYHQIIATRNTVLKYAKTTNNKMLLTVNYHNLASAYSKLKEFNTALTYIDSAIFIAKNEKFKARLSKSFRTKAKINYKLKDYKQAYKNINKHKIYSDSLYGSKSLSNIKEIELKNKYKLEKKDLLLQNEKQVYKRNLCLIILSLFLLLSIFASLFIYMNSKKKSNKITVRLEKEKFEKNVFSQKLEISETELQKLAADNTMRLEFLKQFLNQIKEHKKITDSKEVKDYIKHISLKIQQQITTETKLTVLKHKITSINNSFNNYLITNYNDLTKTEREVCSLLRLNLSIKEIVSIRDSSTDAVKSIRYRIRKKMQIPKDQNLEHFIQNLKT